MSFSEKLKKNQMKSAENTLLQTILEDPNQTIGDVWTSLEDDDESEILWEMFKNMSIGQLVIAGARFAAAEEAAKQPAAESLPADEDEFDDDEDVEYEEEGDDEDEDEDEDEEEDEEGDDEDEEEEDEEGDDEDEDEEEDEEEETPKTRKSKKKKKAGKTSKKKGKDSGDSIDLSTPEAQKTYQGTIVKCLKKNKARNEKKGMAAQDIRKVVGGNPKQLRDHLNLLIGESRIAYGGKARGMKYWLE